MIRASRLVIALVLGVAMGASKPAKDITKKTIHLVPHSHDDVGWLKTLDQYFDGTERNTQWTSVTDTLTTVVNSLLQNPARRYVQIEMKFFSMWFYAQSDEKKDEVRRLVKNGQLEIAGAGWSMHDEACPTYEDMINNHMIGHDFVLKEFGVKPRVGWQIDPFGHSNTNARFFAEMGYDALFFGRMDQKDYERRQRDKELQFVWMPNGDASKKILTHKMWEGYTWLPVGSFDIRQTNHPFIKNTDSVSFDADDISKLFHSKMQEMISYYRGNQIFLQFGDDFAYMNAFGDFTNMDRMIEYINEKYSDYYHIKYSTPSEYIDALANENMTWPTKYDDLFPYSDINGMSDQKSDFWTGYFTSKAWLKDQIRQTSSYTHASSALFTERVLAQDSSITEIEKNVLSKNVMLDAMGINQHHDAVTGTARMTVAKDYAYILSKATRATRGQYSKIVGDKIKDQTSHTVLGDKWMQCTKTNMTYLDCPIAEAVKKTDEAFSMAVAVHNPSSLTKDYFHILVPKGEYTVHKFDDSTGQFETVKSEVVCKQNELDEDYKSLDSCSLHVKHAHLGSKSVSLFNVTRVSNEFTESVRQNNVIRLENSETYMTFVELDDYESMLRFNIKNDEQALDENIDISLKYWEGRANYDKWHNKQSSGAYIFISEEGQFEALPYTKLMKQSKLSENMFQFVMGKIDDEGMLANQANITVEIYKSDQNKVVLKTEVDLFGLPGIQYGGKEVVVEFANPDLNNNGTFYTDSNGLDMQKRILNYRPTWNVSNNYDDGSILNITANFYPVVSAIKIADESKGKTLTVLNDRSQSGTSLENGKVQLMQNRRLFVDDERGLSETLDEHDDQLRGYRIKATYHTELTLNNTVSSQRQLQSQVEEPVQIFYGFGLTQIQGEKQASNLTSALLEAGIRQPIKLLTFPVWKNKLSIRLENLNEMNQTADVDVRAVAIAYWKEANMKYSRDFSNINIEEVSITGNMAISELNQRKIQWKTVDDQYLDPQVIEDKSDDVKTLKPMQIRVFTITYETDIADEIDETQFLI